MNKFPVQFAFYNFVDADFSLNIIFNNRNPP